MSLLLYFLQNKIPMFCTVNLYPNWNITTHLCNLVRILWIQVDKIIHALLSNTRIQILGTCIVLKYKQKIEIHYLKVYYEITIRRYLHENENIKILPYIVQCWLTYSTCTTRSSIMNKYCMGRQKFSTSTHWHVYQEPFL